jgi:hypothetical protein
MQLTCGYDSRKKKLVAGRYVHEEAEAEAQNE